MMYYNKYTSLFLDKTFKFNKVVYLRLRFLVKGVSSEILDENELVKT